ncbi:MAG: YihY/virulence factor BrkB family protein [Acidobacteria bacterium]|nr:YihY/virulence factor BrkB family protein [Acidobacteriota bacterium]
MNDMIVLFRVPLRPAEIVTRTIREIQEDNCLGLAAQLAFYFFLSLFPALLFLVALVGYLPVENVLAQLLQTLGAIAPVEVLALLRTQLDEVARGSYGGLLTLGIVGAIWSSSAAMVAIIDALNHAYDIEERRPWWKRRIVAIALTVALALFIVTSLVLVLVGPDMAFLMAGWVGLGPAFSLFWAVVRWPLMIFLVVLGVDLVYHFAPNRRGGWVWITPGSLLATSLWMAGSFAFKFYVANLGNFNATYGAIGGVAVLLLWFYVSGLAILVGAELNGVIEQTVRARRPATRSQAGTRAGPG